MVLIARLIGKLGRSGLLSQLPPYISATLILVGVAWLLALPLDRFSRKTYISENALLPGQAHTYFSDSEHNVFRAFRHEVFNASTLPSSSTSRADAVVSLFAHAGLKANVQRYQYPDPLNGTISGRNVYAVMDAPRADQTEAIVLMAAWKTIDGDVNYSGISLVVSLARYLSRWSMWSKNVIFLILDDSTAGPQAWVDAYHSLHAEPDIESLRRHAGALQAAVAIDYTAGPWGRRFGKLEIGYDGVNGQLPNLDLVNAAAIIASNHAGIGVVVQAPTTGPSPNSYKTRLGTMLRGLVNQAAGVPSGPHSPFIRYHVDAITLKAVADGWHDEISLGRTVESLVRSVNNLTEHFHQSFFFYLLVAADRFVSIGTYLPCAMLVAANFTVMAIALWLKNRATTTPKANRTALVAVTVVYLSGLAPAWSLIYLSLDDIRTVMVFHFYALSAIALLMAYILGASNGLTELFHSYVLLVHGLVLATLATVNFSLAFFLGLVTAPLSFLTAFSPLFRPLIGLASVTVVSLMSLALVVGILCQAEDRVGDNLLKKSMLQAIGVVARSTTVNGMWTTLVLLLILWPAWMTVAIISLRYLCRPDLPDSPKEVTKPVPVSTPTTTATTEKQ